MLIAGTKQTFQCTTQLSRRRRGVHAIPELGKCTRELPSRPPTNTWWLAASAGLAT